MAGAKFGNDRPESPLKEAIRGCRGAFGAVVVFSLCINLLLLAAPLYMLQIFDRVITSRSIDSLVYLTLIVLLAICALAALEAVRNRVLVRVSTWLDSRLGGAVLANSIVSGGKGTAPQGIQGLRDLSALRSFLTGPAIFPILDAPWTPIFIGVIFLMHPLLGWLALCGAVALFILAIANELATRRLLEIYGAKSIVALRHAEAAVRNANAVAAMGMMPNLVQRWQDSSRDILGTQASASLRAGAIAALSKLIRQSLQIGVLGVGAWLVLGNEITAGVMIAASILMSRALAPVEQAIGSWKSAVATRTAYRRIKRLLAEGARHGPSMSLPAPQGRVRAENLSYAYPGATEPTIRNVDFRLEPGEVLGLIGTTAAGKTTLANLLVGVLGPSAGHVRLDGADVADWDSEDLGPHVGYLPQDVELFSGTVRENIARMGPTDADKVVEAARLADVHEMILALPNGYETEIGEGGMALSGGQRQRIGLARAVFNDPKFVVLDEPNANLDGAGEEALLNVIATLKSRGTTLVVITHRPSLLRNVDTVLVLQQGTVGSVGPTDQIIPAVTSPRSTPDPVQASAG